MPLMLRGRVTIPAKTSSLIDYAVSVGVRVEWARHLPERGRYIPTHRLIVLRYGMTERRTVSTLAHELGHAHYGDWCAVPGVEARAWRYAARLLISDEDLKTAATTYDTDVDISRELGVTLDVLHAYTQNP